MDPKNNKQEESDFETKQFIGLNDIKVDIQKTQTKKLDHLSQDATWEQLKVDATLIDVLITKGFKKPSIIQQKVIPLKNCNYVVAQSQNGSGKTLAYLIPCLQLIDPNNKGKDEFQKASPQIIILGDTKALILQVHRILRSLLDSYQGYEDVKIDYLFSGKTTLQDEVQILLTTIAQFKKFVTKKNISINKIKYLVVDEADHVFESDLGKNFFATFLNIIMKNKELKIHLTSATMTDDFKKIIDKLNQKGNVISVELPVEELTLKNVYQFMIKYNSPNQKLEILNSIIKNINAQNILIFGNSRHNLIQLQEYLLKQNFKVAFVYSQKKKQISTADYLQQQIKDFLAGKYRILLTTNLLARGIDMRKVTLVINYSLPLKFFEDRSIKKREVDLETYLHRVGRTGRFGDWGIALNLVDKQTDQQLIDQIQNYYKNSIKEINIDQFGDVNQILKDINEKNTQKREFFEENIQLIRLSLSQLIFKSFEKISC